MSLLDDALSIVTDVGQSSAGERVAYRSGDTVVHLIAIRGRLQFDEAAGEMDARVRARSLQWLIKPRDLIDAGINEPSRGDEIEIASGTIYDVLPGPGDVHFEYTDQFQTFVRVYSLRR